MDTKQRCTALTKAGKRCKNTALPGSNPPRCGIPAHAAQGPGAPTGNKNAEKHGYYSKPNSLKATSPATSTVSTDVDAASDLEASIADLKKKGKWLSHHIDEHALDLDAMEYAKLIDLLGRLRSRIVRLEDKLRETAGHGGDEFLQIMDTTLDKLSAEWGIEL